MTEKVFSELDHVGGVVHDLDKAIRYYESLGIGPFEEISTDRLTGKTMYGKRFDFELRVAMAKMGGAKLELIQPVKDAPLMEDFLKSKGEGINHLAFLVNNIEEETARLTKKGFKVIFSAKLPSGGGAVYLNTDKVGGVVIELLKW